MFLRFLCAVFGCHLRGKGSTLAGPLETLETGRRPGNHIANRIGYGDDGIVERRLDMGNASGYMLTFFLLLYDSFCRACHYSSPYLRLLFLSGNGSCWTFPSSCIGLRSLPTDREPFAMPEPAIASKIHEALYIHGDVPAKITFDFEILVDVFANSSDLTLCELIGSRVGIHSGFCDDFLSSCPTYSIDIGKCYFDPLVTGQVNSSYTCQCRSSSSGQP